MVMRAMQFKDFCVGRKTYWKEKYVHPLVEHYWPECLLSDGLSREELLKKQQNLLQDLVDHAVKHVPFYMNWARESGYKSGDKIKIGDLPVVTKDDYRRDMEMFQSSAYPLNEMGLAKTSGSSGEPFRFRTHSISKDYSYACLWRNLRRHGIRPGMRRGYIWGRSWTFSQSPMAQRKTRLMLSIRDYMNNAITLSAYELTHKNVRRVVEKLESFGPEYLHGYVSALYTIAQYLLERGAPLKGMRLRAVVTESEKLYDFQREALKQAFGCPVLEMYGSVEMGGIAAPDLDGNIRVNDDHCLLEVDSNGQALVTNLRSYAFPFIRYRLGDIVEVSDDIPAGLPYTCIKSIVGRTVDMIPVSKGGSIHGVALAHIIDPHLDYVAKYQIHQVSLNYFKVFLVCKRELPPRNRDQIISAFVGMAGVGTRVELCFVDHIDPAPSGKFRWVISDIHCK